MRIVTGVIKKVLVDEQFKLLEENKAKHEDYKLIDTVRQVTTSDGESFEYLPIKLSFKDVESDGRTKYYLDEETNTYSVIYKTTPILRAYAKEMRILLELAEFSPVKLAITEEVVNNNTYHKIVLVQDQMQGKI